MLSLLALSGCAAFRPLKGVPARYLPDELKGCSRENGQMIDLSYLRQRAPAEYMLDAGDVLAVYVEKILGTREQPPINQPLDNTRPPTLGYPLTVRDDGTLSLPLIQPINVRGKTIPQIERELHYAYTVQRRLLPPGQDRILVTLHRPRQHRILVIRQETQSDVLTGVSVSGGTLGTAKKGTGHVVSLPAYRNDVLNALVESGGLPGLDAQNVVYVMRDRRSQQTAALHPQPSQLQQFGPGFGQQDQLQQPGNIPMQNPMQMPFEMPPQGQMLQPGYGPLSARSPSAGRRASWPAVERPVTERLVVRAQNSDATSALSARVSHSHIQQINYRTTSGPRQAAPIQMAQYQPDSQWQSPPPMQQFEQPMQQFQQPIPTQQYGPLQQSMQQPANWANAQQIARGNFLNPENSLRIPLRLEEYEQVNFTERDIILEDGDIVFIASRDDELFYTGGLLGGGEYTLPRDRDLDILEAIAIAESRASGATSGRSSLNSDVSISPSEAIVLRKMPNGEQVPILVDLYRARTSAAERINIQPGDYIIVQFTKMEAVGAFVERHILESALFGVAASQFSTGRR